MKQWKISVQASGYSRGWLSAVVEAESPEQAQSMARDVDHWKDGSTVRDDREIDFDWVKVEPYEEPTPRRTIEIPEAPEGTLPVLVFLDRNVAEAIRDGSATGVSMGARTVNRAIVLPEA